MPGNYSHPIHLDPFHACTYVLHIIICCSLSVTHSVVQSKHHVASVPERRNVAFTRLVGFVQVLLKIYGMGAEFFRKKLEVGKFSCLEMDRAVFSCPF